MGNRHRSREVREQLELRDAWHRARTERRRVDDHVRIPGIGRRLLQVVYMPPFDPGFAWDVRDAKGGWTLFRADVVSEAGVPYAAGYTPLQFEGRTLGDYVDRAQRISLPCRPWNNGMGGLDGRLYQLAVFGDLHSHVRFQWWEDPPPGWEPLASLTTGMVTDFLAAPASPDQPFVAG